MQVRAPKFLPLYIGAVQVRAPKFLPLCIGAVQEGGRGRKFWAGVCVLQCDRRTEHALDRARGRRTAPGGLRGHCLGEAAVVTPDTGSCTYDG